MRIAQIDANGSRGLSGFLIAWIVFGTGMVVNFFLTANPYAANHGGKVAAGAEVFSEKFVLHLGVLLALGIGAAACVRVRHIPLELILGALVITAWVVFTGDMSDALRLYPAGYCYTLLSFIGVAFVAYIDEKQMRSMNGKIFVWLLIILYIIAFVLALLRPTVWGWIPFTFSREERGGIPLATLLALPPLLTTSIVSFSGSRNLIAAVVIVFIVIVESSIMTRTTIMLLVTPLLIAVIFYFLRSFSVRSMQIVFRRFAFAGYLFALFAVIYGIYWGLSQDDLEEFVNRRWPLWTWHFELFVDNMAYGAGMFPVVRLGNYDGLAKTEIGVLAVFSQYGAVVGMLQVFIVLRALKRGISSWLDNRATEMSRFCGIVVITMIPLWLFDSCWRILAAQDLLFWYSVFFLGLVRHRQPFVWSEDCRMRRFFSGGGGA